MGRINRSLWGIKSRLVFAATIKIKFLLTLPLLIKTSIEDGSAKDKANRYIAEKKEELMSKIQYAQFKAKDLYYTYMAKLEAMKQEGLKSVASKVLDDSKAKAKITA